MNESTKKTNENNVCLAEANNSQTKSPAIDINSIAASIAGIEFGSIARELRKAWACRVVYYLENEGLTPQQAVEKAKNPQPDISTEKEYQHILSQPVNTMLVGNSNPI
ncbi:MAG: hypothetical protein IPK14_18260 [Blastocatellia bacterium]|nr:hypothetical protein [Blastocatellia bacterium]